MTRVLGIAEAVADRWRGQLCERLGDVPGVRVERSGDGVRMSGRRLRARWLADAGLRWLRDRL